MRKILILGSSGAGKSTFAAQLADAVGLPLIHLDVHYWRPGWERPPRDEWRRRVAELLRLDAWIMDGNYGSTIPERLDAADTAILLTVSRLRCVYRVIGRGLRNRGKSRADRPTGCVERFPEWDFLRWIWSYPRRDLPRVLELLRTRGRGKTIVVLRSNSEIESYLARVRAATPHAPSGIPDAQRIVT